MPSFWIVLLFLYKICSAEAVGNPELSVVSVTAGEAVTLKCTSAFTDKSKTAYWFKHRLEHKLQEVGFKLSERGKIPQLVDPFKNSKSVFNLEDTGSGLSLSIERVQKEDEGMYFCGSVGDISGTFSTGTFLAVSDPSDTSVLQTTAVQSVPPGEAVNLQCKVLSEIRSAELRVFWIRSAVGSSFPEIIYIHHNSSSSRQCEINSSNHSYSSNILNNHHTATYYCTLETCRKIIIRNRTAVDLSSAEAVGNSEPSVVSVKAGEAVTLKCTSAFTEKSKTAYWFKHRLEHKLQEVGFKLGESGKIPELVNPFKNSKSGFDLKETGSGLSLSIERVQKEDEGMYFCGSVGDISVTFSTGTFLAVSDPSDISVLQSPALQSVSPGEAVNLQCTVLSEIKSAELRVFWIRSVAGSFFSETIYNSSCGQYEISSSKHSCVYTFNSNTLKNHHTATYYCAVETCGRVIIGNGTTVDLKSHPQPVLVIILGLALALSLFCNIVQIIWIWIRGNCSGVTSQSVLHNLPEILQSQDDDNDDEEFHFPALNSSDKKTGTVFKEKVFTSVRFTPFTYDKLTQ